MIIFKILTCLFFCLFIMFVILASYELSLKYKLMRKVRKGELNHYGGNQNHL